MAVTNPGITVSLQGEIALSMRFTEHLFVYGVCVNVYRVHEHVYEVYNLGTLYTYIVALRTIASLLFPKTATISRGDVSCCRGGQLTCYCPNSQ